MLNFLSSYGGYAPSGQDEIPEELLAVIMTVYLGFLLITLAFGLVVYILQSLGMYKIAHRRGIQNPWLAWVPVGNVWMLGSISDQYQYLVKGKRTNRRKILLGMSLGTYALLLAMIIVMFIGVIGAAMSGSEAEAARAAGLMVIGIFLIYFAAIALAITQVVFQYISYYDLFASSNPANATLYLVLSIFVTVTLPFFVFACRNKDGGMPPRKAEVEPQQPVAGPVFVPAAQFPAAPVVETPVAPVAEPAEEQAPAIFSDEGTQQ